jgi:hypothetical protein
MGFMEVLQEPCVMKRGGIICFFYEDDIVFAYRKKDAKHITGAITEMRKYFKLNVIGELKWFLGIHIFRNRLKRSLWLSQQAYIEKLANEFTAGAQSDRWPPTPMAEEELLPLPIDDEIIEADKMLYQRKIGSILYAAISSRPDIAFAAARLSRHNCRPGRIHQEATDRVIKYLYRCVNDVITPISLPLFFPVRSTVPLSRNRGSATRIGGKHKDKVLYRGIGGV